MTARTMARATNAAFAVAALWLAGWGVAIWVMG